MLQRTYSAKAADIKRQWHLVDVADKVLGRAASQIATLLKGKHKPIDRKSTRLNSSHQIISYAVFCLKKKKKNRDYNQLISTYDCLSGNTHCRIVERSDYTHPSLPNQRVECRTAISDVVVAIVRTSS